MNISRPTIMEVDLNAFEYNIEQIKKYVGDNITIMPVIKANGYGTGINFRNDIINKFDIVAVALVEEAVELRNQGFQKEIFVLNQPYETEIKEIIENDVTVGISDYSFLEKLGKIESKVKVHIEIETGMGRTGINSSEVIKFIDKIKSYSNIEIEGIYTHLSSADYDEEHTRGQLEIFDKAINNAKKILGDIKYIHCSASNGILNHKNSYYNTIRAGIILYGYESFNETKEKIDLKPVCKLKSKITFLKEVEVGTSIGYSRTYVTKRKTKVATIPLGYADGLRRALSNKGEVVVKGKKAPIIGNICMDSFMIDVTEIDDVAVGEDVYIWDNAIITIEEIAKKSDTINYEIMSTISNRVPRVYRRD